YLAQHLQTRLARQLGAVANLYFVTPAMLLTRLDQEAPGQVLPLLPQDHVRDFLIKEILNQPGLNRYALSRGFGQAVKSSLRDLADSLADPDVLREHLLSMPDYVLEQDGGRFAWLVEVYKQYLARENTLPGYRPYQTAFERALNGVETSSYLAQFSQHIIYGFYDMPGRQLELMDRLRACYDVTVFAPYQKHPAYTFAQKFFETNWLTSPGAQDVNEPAPPTALGASAPYIFASSGSAPNERVQIVSAPDLKGSIFYVAKEISKLLAGGQSPADIAVLVRNTQEYQDEIRRTFQENCLPLSASFTYPLYKSALGRLCLNLFELASCGFAREKVLSVFSSPYFKQENKFNWCRLVNRSLVSRDVSQWNDLLPQTAGFDPEVLNWINATHARLEGLSAAQPWQQGVQAALAFLAEQVDTRAFEPKDAQLYQQIEETLRKMITYAAVRPQCHDGELISEIAQALSSVTYHEVENVPAGITFTDALRARGLRFKTVFVLGLNDQEFPLLTP
ncbi:MAG: exodeoxyribonuclease V subunit gamma, partial [Elusimicrobiaceae bacterium]|nr:exodeoxyribonuclease V subunit gamma [Elusimicrobiaceae bacterium]